VLKISAILEQNCRFEPHHFDLAEAPIETKNEGVTYCTVYCWEQLQSQDKFLRLRLQLKKLLQLRVKSGTPKSTQKSWSRYIGNLGGDRRRILYWHDSGSARKKASDSWQPDRFGQILRSSRLPSGYVAQVIYQLAVLCFWKVGRGLNPRYGSWNIGSHKAGLFIATVLWIRLSKNDGYGSNPKYLLFFHTNDFKVRQNVRLLLRDFYNHRILNLIKYRHSFVVNI
jgi:hypothetical protein